MDVSPDSSFVTLSYPSGTPKVEGNESTRYGTHSASVEDSIERKMPSGSQAMPKDASPVSGMTVTAAIGDSVDRKDLLKSRMESASLDGFSEAGEEMKAVFDKALECSAPDESHVDAILESFGNPTFSDANVQGLCRKAVAQAIKPQDCYPHAVVANQRENQEQLRDLTKAHFESRQTELMGSGLSYYTTGMLGYLTGFIDAQLTDEKADYKEAQAGLDSFNESVTAMQGSLRKVAIERCSGVINFLQGLGDIDSEKDAEDFKKACQELGDTNDPQNAEKIVLIMALIGNGSGLEAEHPVSDSMDPGLFNAIHNREDGNWKMTKNNWRDSPLMSFCLAIKDGSNLNDLKKRFEAEYANRFEKPFEV